MKSLLKSTKSNFSRKIASIMAGAGLLLWAGAKAQCVPVPESVSNEKTPPLEFSQPTNFEVEMQTSLTLPATGVKVGEVQIWQALPTKRSWSESSDNSGALNVKFAPAGGVNEFRPEYESNHLVWKLRQNLDPGKHLSFTCDYSIHSVARRFDPRQVALHWAPNFTPPTDINPELARAADEIRKTCDPGKAVLEFCTSIKKEIKYDASVPYAASDVDAIVANRRGHCGHMYSVLAQMCRRVGIPIRIVRGLNLYQPDGHGTLSDVRADWTNVHTWAEVEFPEVGWIEVEPQGGADAFSIPARYIQNNKWFQNYVVKILADGKWQGAGWTPEHGTFVSPYQVANVITFRATEG